MLFVSLQFASLDHFITGGTVERTGPVSVIFELLLIDVDRASEHVVAVGLAVAGLAHPLHVVLQDGHDGLGPAEQRGTVHHPSDQFIDMNGPLALAGVGRANR